MLLFASGCVKRVPIVLPYMFDLQEAGKKAEDFVCGRYTGDEGQSESILVGIALPNAYCHGFSSTTQLS
jgi:hypothetical protein